MTLDADNLRLLLGLDLGGTKTVVVLARADGEILAESRLEGWTTGAWESDLDTVIQHAEVLLRGASLTPSALAAIGVSAPGPLDIAAGRVIEAPNLNGWVDVPIVERLFQRFAIPVLLENDANAAALAEWQFGAGQGSRNMIYLTMSTGVGAGLILDGRIYRGARYQAGEIGHAAIVPMGRLCACGLKGCLEAYTSGSALAEIIREDIERGAETQILERAHGDPAAISARLWCEAIRDKDRYALRLRLNFLDHLAQGIASAITTFDPQRVVLGTIIQKNADLFLDDLTDRVRERTWPSLHHVDIVVGALGDQLPAFAALSVARQDLAKLPAS